MVCKYVWRYRNFSNARFWGDTVYLERDNIQTGPN